MKETSDELKNRITIRDVAELAGVSISTVSNFLNENFRNMSAETRERVERAIDTLDYFPSLGAQSLPRKRATQTICIVIPHDVDYTFHHPYFAEVMRGIASSIDAEGYRALILTTKGKDHSEAAYIRGLSRALVDGAIFFDVEPQDPYVHEFAGSRLPFMIVGRSEETNHFVDADIERGVADAADHLLNLGHRAIALISGPTNLVFSEQLVRGYRFALERRGVAVQEELVTFGPFSEENGHSTIESLLASHPEPTAAIAGSGKQAIGVIEYLRKNEMRVPDDLSIVSFGHHPIATLHGLSLTYLDQPEVEIGRTVAESLLTLIRNPAEQFTPKILPLQLIIGESTTGIR